LLAQQQSLREKNISKWEVDVVEGKRHTFGLTFEERLQLSVKLFF